MFGMLHHVMHEPSSGVVQFSGQSMGNIHSQDSQKASSVTVSQASHLLSQITSSRIPIKRRMFEKDDKHRLNPVFNPMSCSSSWIAPINVLHLNSSNTKCTNERPLQEKLTTITHVIHNSSRENYCAHFWPNEDMSIDLRNTSPVSFPSSY